jgi:hypothetical protein
VSDSATSATTRVFNIPAADRDLTMRQCGTWNPCVKSGTHDAERRTREIGTELT